MEQYGLQDETLGHRAQNQKNTDYRNKRIRQWQNWK